MPLAALAQARNARIAQQQAGCCDFCCHGGEYIIIYIHIFDGDIYIHIYNYIYMYVYITPETDRTAIYVFCFPSFFLVENDIFFFLKFLS